MSGVYCFATCFPAYPLAAYEDRSMAYGCTSVCLLVIFGVVLLSGTTVNSGYFDTLEPYIRLQAFPRNAVLRALVLSDNALLLGAKNAVRENIKEDADTVNNHNELRKFFDDIGMQALAPAFEAEKLSLSHIPALTPNDFIHMGIKIGDRINILEALNRRADSKTSEMTREPQPAMYSVRRNS